MKYIKVFENYNNRSELISEIETIAHILQDEYHEIELKVNNPNSISIYVDINNLQKIEDESYIEMSNGPNSEYTDTDKISLNKIMELEEMIEFSERLEEICKNFKYEYDILFLSGEVIFNLFPISSSITTLQIIFNSFDKIV